MKQKSKECGERHWRRKAEEKSGGKNCTDEEGESGGGEYERTVEKRGVEGVWKSEAREWRMGVWSRRVEEESEGREWKT